MSKLTPEVGGNNGKRVSGRQDSIEATLLKTADRHGEDAQRRRRLASNESERFDGPDSKGATMYSMEFGLRSAYTIGLVLIHPAT